MKAIKSIAIITVLFTLASCGGKEFKKNPVDLLVKDMPTDRVFSIILNDMDVQGSFFHKYTHQYKIVEEREAGKPEEYVSGWYEVDERFFKQHANDMGMEITSRGADGKLHKGASPPGYNNYVGNQQYGRWESRGGSSFWAFYGQYAFMSSMFNMMAYPARRSHYNDYRGGYYGTGRSYYGPRNSTTGGTAYGTNSAYTKSTGSGSTWGKNNSSFKQRVSSRTSRSGSRYGSSSSRSRGGGFGK